MHSVVCRNTYGAVTDTLYILWKMKYNKTNDFSKHLGYASLISFKMMPLGQTIQVMQILFLSDIKY